MAHSYFDDTQALDADKVLITVLKKKDRYYLMAEGIVATKHVVKVLTQYENYFLKLPKHKLKKYQHLPIHHTFFIPTEQFNANTHQKLKLRKNLAFSLKQLLDEQQKDLAISQLQNPVPEKNLVDRKAASFKQNNHYYLRLTVIDAIREGLDWATMPLLFFWIPICFANLSMPILMIVLILTAMITLVVAGYTMRQHYSADKKELKRLMENLIHDPLELPQRQDLSYTKDLGLPAFVTATSLFSFFWVTYDVLVALGIISSVSMPIFPLIAIPICLAVSFVFAGLHYCKLNVENQLYEAICYEKAEYSLQPLALDVSVMNQLDFSFQEERYSSDETEIFTPRTTTPQTSSQYKLI